MSWWKIVSMGICRNGKISGGKSSSGNMLWCEIVVVENKIVGWQNVAWEFVEWETVAKIESGKLSCGKLSSGKLSEHRISRYNLLKWSNYAIRTSWSSWLARFLVKIRVDSKFDIFWAKIAIILFFMSMESYNQGILGNICLFVCFE